MATEEEDTVNNANDSSGDDNDNEETIVGFAQMGLDSRLLRAIDGMGWPSPTLIQEKAIPLALEGNDILAKARTGTGKSAAFALPILNGLLTSFGGDGGADGDSDGHQTRHVRALVLSPTKELCHQLTQHFQSLTTYCSREISVLDISAGRVDDLRGVMIAETPDIVVGTPSRVLMHIEAKHMPSLKQQLKYLVIDESDLMLSFGYADDLQRVLRSVPAIGCQTFLMSATLNPDVKNLKKLCLHNPVILKLEEPPLPESDQLIQYHIECEEEEEKFVLINSMFKLGLIRGKTIVFVSSVDRCYRLKLFLEQFGVKSCILNSELPVGTRCHVVQQFNSGVYDIIIASDEKCAADPCDRSKSSRKASKRRPDEEYGVSRGIDFKYVSNVVNFDFPTTVTSYTHRVGRVARGDDSGEGTVLSLIGTHEKAYFEAVRDSFSPSANFRPYQFRMEELEAFKYRSRDALRAVTTIAIREARIKEIKREILASQQLKSYFEQNPKDQRVLRHDRSLHTVKHKQHLRDVPEYIIPPTLQSMVKSKKGTNKRLEEEASLSYTPSKRKRRPKHLNNSNKRDKNADPLKSFRFSAKKRGKPKLKNRKK